MTTLNEIPTPTLILDLDRLERNLCRMGERAASPRLDRDGLESSLTGR